MFSRSIICIVKMFAEYVVFVMVRLQVLLRFTVCMALIIVVFMVFDCTSVCLFTSTFVQVFQMNI